VVAVVGHGDQRDVVVVLAGLLLVSLLVFELGEDAELDEPVSELEVLDGVEGAEDDVTLPEAFIDAVVEVSVDGVEVVMVVVLVAGVEVSVEVVVVAGDWATVVVVEPGVALVPELL